MSDDDGMDSSTQVPTASRAWAPVTVSYRASQEAERADRWRNPVRPQLSRWSVLAWIVSGFSSF
jgi:hypothetical protein